LVQTAFEDVVAANAESAQRLAADGDETTPAVRAMLLFER
jgi:hypothetical protein